ncbi:MAG: diaminopimelate epimerase, partial [Clostridia bacterium]|nr:diaminopimelate epimerase [Clostridia bacterium]
QDKLDLLTIAKKFGDLGCTMYATKGTAKVINDLGIDCSVVERLSATDRVIQLMDEGKIDYIVYTGKTDMESINDFIKLHHHAILLGITVLTALDTANALADIIASRFTEDNTELVDINALRDEKLKLDFTKMQSCGNDYIIFDNRDGKITCPESITVSYVQPHYGIGGDGVVLIENSDVADAKVRVFNKNGIEAPQGGNAIRCVAKYLFEKGIVRKTDMTLETGRGVCAVKVYSFAGQANSASVNLGKVELAGKNIPCVWDEQQIVNKPLEIKGKEYGVTLVNVGNPHCVIFTDKVDAVNVEEIGAELESSPYFPEGINTEFIRVVNKVTLKMRVWERGSGETWACGTGACAAVVAAVLGGYCEMDTNVTVKVRGGDLTVNYHSNGEIELMGNVKTVFEGTFEI